MGKAAALGDICIIKILNQFIYSNSNVWYHPTDDRHSFSKKKKSAINGEHNV